MSENTEDATTVGWQRVKDMSEPTRPPPELPGRLPWVQDVIDERDRLAAEVSRLKADIDSADAWLDEAVGDYAKGDPDGLRLRCESAAKALTAMRANPPSENAILQVEVARLKADNERLTAELALWKPMTPAEAQAAYDAAEAVPVSEEEIERMVAFATDPANRLNNEEEAQLHVRYRKVCAANADLRATVAAREATIAGTAGVLERIKSYCEACLTNENAIDGHDIKGILAWVKSALAADAGSSLLAERDALKAKVAELEGMVLYNGLDAQEQCGRAEAEKKRADALLARLRSAEACAKMLDAQRKCNQLGTDTDELVDTWLKLTEVSSDERH